MWLAALAGAGGVCAPASAQLRVVNWNVTAYSSGRVADFQNAIFGTAPNGQRMFPDIIVAEEIAGATGANNFLSLLNTYPGGPTDWARADYVDTTVNPGSNPSQALFYRTSKVELLAQHATDPMGPSTIYTEVLDDNTGSCSTCPPRDNHRFRVRLKGYTSAGAEIFLYAAHFKAGSAGSDSARRVPEAQRLRTDTALLPAGAVFLLCGDFNMQNSSQTEYATLLSTSGVPAGRFIDPINTPGTWENSSSFRFVHTQDPVLGSDMQGMDSRLDQILISPTLRETLSGRDTRGIEYIGSPTLAYSTTTWNDPNHSFRAFGNDGSTFNVGLATTTNSFVGAAIAQDLIDSATTGGHLPVYLDLRIPPRIILSTSTINIGTVPQNSVQTHNFTVGNNLDTALWDRGGAATIGGVERLQTLQYNMTAGAGLSVPLSNFSDGAGGGVNTHAVTIDTSTPGAFSRTITVLSNALDTPSVTITVTGVIETPAPTACNLADVTGIGGNGSPPDGALTVDDLIEFVNAFSDGSGCPGTAPCNLADVTGIGGPPALPDGDLTVDDLIAFVNAFSEGCP